MKCAICKKWLNPTEIDEIKSFKNKWWFYHIKCMEDKYPLMTYDPMKLPQALKILKRYQDWRRGWDWKMEDPTELWIAIDIIIKELENETKILD